MENKGFDNIGDYNSTSSNSVLSNAVSDDVGKKYVTAKENYVFNRDNQRRTSFELDVFTNLNKIDIYPTDVTFIEDEGEKYVVRKNLEDLYYAILTPDGGKVVDTFLRNLFVWNTVDVEDSYLQTTDVKDSLGFTLARILRHTSSEYRYNKTPTL